MLLNDTVRNSVRFRESCDGMKSKMLKIKDNPTPASMRSVSITIMKTIVRFTVWFSAPFRRHCYSCLFSFGKVG